MVGAELFRGLPLEEQAAFLRLFNRAAAARTWHVKPEELLDRWNQTIHDCCNVYDFRLDDYTNDLTAREIIEDTLDYDKRGSVPNFRSLLAGLDDSFLRATVQMPEPVFGDSRARSNHDRLFFYFRVPRAPGVEMTEDLIRMKFIRSADDLRPGTSLP